MVEAADNIQKGRLSGAGLAEDSHEFAISECNRDVVDLDDISQLKH